MKSWYLFILSGLVLVGLALFYQLKVRTLEQKMQELKTENTSLKDSITKLNQENKTLRSRLTPPVRQSWVSIDDDEMMGDQNAPLTLIEFSEFQCPYCARFSNQTFQEIKKQYIDTGKLKFVFRDYPLAFHENASRAAEAAECAGDQGLYWEMNKLLFENYTKIGIEDLKQYAERLGLFMPDFLFCLESGKNAAEIQKDMHDGKQAGVMSTPSFFIGLSREDGRIFGTFIKGAKPFKTFQQMFEQTLRQAGPEERS